MNLTAIGLEDDEGVIIGPHDSLENQWPLDELEKEVYSAIVEEKQVSLSKLWKKFGCHLWELVAVLNRLKRKGLVTEQDD